MRLTFNTSVALLSFFLFYFQNYGQQQASNPFAGAANKVSNDTVEGAIYISAKSEDSLKVVDTLSLKFADSEIKNPIEYSAEDSIVYDLESQTMYLYKSADIKYEKIELKADSVVFEWKTFTLSAGGRINDSSGRVEGKPVFTDNGKEYRAGRMAYNFKTKKGKVYDVITQEGEAYIHSQAVKRNEFDEWYSHRAKYTTCNLDEPHFYFQSKKVKVVPNKVLVTGPANLVVAGTPTPLFIPFGIFPARQGRRSGIIVPKPGRDVEFGFFLREGGYFWAVNDYFNLKLTGDIFTNGTFGLSVGSQYKVNYKASGNIAINYYRTQPADPDLPGAKATNAFGITWSHVQDPKSIPNSNLSINLNANTSNFYTASRITDSRLLQTQFNSGASFTRIFPGKPVSINLTFNHAQNLLNRTVSIRFPVLSVNMTRITPFKRKISSAKARWYENIGFIYAFEAKSFVNTFDSLFFRKETFTRDLKYGINQTFRADLPLVLFRYFNFSPSFNYQERWFFKKEQRRWNPDTVVIINPQTQKADTLFGRIQSDTTFGFYGVRDFNIAVTFNTKLTGIFRFKNKWVKSLRHVLTPEIAFSYRPDFSAPRWRYYTTVQRDAAGNRLKYGHYDFLNDVFPVPAGGQVGQINFSLLNNFDLKTFSRTDTSKQEKILGILERFRISTGYNFLADSLHWQPLVLEGFSRISNNLSINFNIDFDPYARDSLNNRINTFYIQERGRPLRLNEARLALNASFQAKRRPQPPAPAPPRGFSDYVSPNPDDFYDFNIPWSFNTSLNLSLRKGTIRNPDTLLTTLALQVSGDFNLTPNWKFGINTGFDFRDKLPTLTNLTVLRNLHCWELSFNWTAFPVTVQQFVIELRIKSAVLQDLKLVRRRTFLQGGF